MNAPELLAPAGNMDCVRAALRYGADAVYLGGPFLQLRATSSGFSMENMEAAIALAHVDKKRVYVTVNAFARNEDIDAVQAYARDLYALGADAVIVSDIGLISAIHEAEPRLEIHVSTQANCTNYRSALTYHALGASRVVLARELSLEDIDAIHRRIPEELQLEAFVHGAMCMAYSGRCMISAHLTGRSANRGGCAQSCRWNYRLVEEKRPGEYMPVEEDDAGTTILSARDLCAMPFLDRLIDAGVSSFKIEGRMKTESYVATVVRAYRRRIDQILSGAKEDGLDELMEELDQVSHRPYSSGFYFGQAKREAPDDGVYQAGSRFVGKVTAYNAGRAYISLRNRFKEGDVLEILPAKGDVIRCRVLGLQDADGAPVDAASVPEREYSFLCAEIAAPGDIIRMRNV